MFYIEKAFQKDWLLEIAEDDTNTGMGAFIANPKSQYRSYTLSNLHIGEFYDYDVYKSSGITLTEWRNLSDFERDTIIREIDLFEERKEKARIEMMAKRKKEEENKK